MELETIIELAQEGIKRSPAGETEIIVSQSHSALTRFFANQIHQNVAEVNGWVSVRAVIDGKIGVASTNLLTTEAINEAVKKASEAAKLAPQDKNFAGLPQAARTKFFSRYHEKTARLTPAERAKIVAQIVKKVSDYKELAASGSLSNETYSLVVANSVGNLAAAKITNAALNLVVSDSEASGFSQWLGYDIEQLNIEAVSEKAAQKAYLSKNPVEIEPQPFTVILEPPAVADMLSFLAYIGFSAQALQEKRSFLVGRLGQQVVSDKLNFFDDANDKRTIGLTFDFEGVPKQKVVFFEQGVAKEVVYDSYTAAKEKRQSTGHALPAPNVHGPLPTNLILEPGSTAYDALVASLEYGLLITRFHYTNIEDPVKTIFTGMTRDGTFLVENGEIKAPVKNLRFTQSIVEALNNVDLVGADGCLNSTMLQSCYAPSLKIKGFNFTGLSKK